MAKLFTVDANLQVELNRAELLLIPEFSAIIRRDRGSDGDHDGRKKFHARKVFTFIYFYCDWKSPLKDFTLEAKKKEALRTAGLEDKHIDGIVRDAMDIYESYQETLSTKLLHSTYNTIRNLTEFFDNVDLDEKDVNDRAVYKPLEIINSLKNVGNVYAGLKELESLVMKEQQEQGDIRGKSRKGNREDPS
jgi:hypothetical protein